MLLEFDLKYNNLELLKTYKFKGQYTNTLYWTSKKVQLSFFK